MNNLYPKQKCIGVVMYLWQSGIIKPYNDMLYISAYWTALKHKKHLLPELNTPNDTIHIKERFYCLLVGITEKNTD